MGNDTGEVIAALERGRSNEIRVAVRSFEGKQFVDIRMFYLDSEEKWWPTKKGVAIPVSRWGEFYKIISKADELLKQRTTK